MHGGSRTGAELTLSAGMKAAAALVGSYAGRWV